MITAYVTHRSFTDHEFPGRSHPEHPGRIESVWQHLEAGGISSKLHAIEPILPQMDQLLLTHTREHLSMLDWIAGQERLVMIDADTYALPESVDIAKRAAGACIPVIDHILSGRATNGLVAVRPPGHHATQQRPMGFCLLNNVAVAAHHLQHTHQFDRILIVDIDVHHGNGTQDIFYHDPGVLFVSTHQYQYPFFPGTGAINEIGEGKGRGYTLNIPLKPGSGDSNYLRLFNEVIWPAARRYEPQMILVSAGFDAHWVDPLASMNLSLPGYAAVTRTLISMADELCNGRIAFVMEGGYDLQALGHGMLNIAYALTGDDRISDPYGLANRKEPDISALIAELRQLHHLG